MVGKGSVSPVRAQGRTSPGISSSKLQGRASPNYGRNSPNYGR